MVRPPVFGRRRPNPVAWGSPHRARDEHHPPPGTGRGHSSDTGPRERRATSLLERAQRATIASDWGPASRRPRSASGKTCTRRSWQGHARACTKKSASGCIVRVRWCGRGARVDSCPCAPSRSTLHRGSGYSNGPSPHPLFRSRNFTAMPASVTSATRAAPWDGVAGAHRSRRQVAGFVHC